MDTQPEPVVVQPTSCPPATEDNQTESHSVESAATVAKDEEAAADEDDSDSEHGDEIDLFASEESESENEGRFKCAKPERDPQVATVSFSSLVSGSLLATATTVGIDHNLDEISTALGIGSASDEPHRMRERRQRGGHRRRRDGVRNTNTNNNNAARDRHHGERNATVGRGDGRHESAKSGQQRLVGAASGSSARDRESSSRRRSVDRRRGDSDEKSHGELAPKNAGGKHGKRKRVVCPTRLALFQAQKIVC